MYNKEQSPILEQIDFNIHELLKGMHFSMNNLVSNAIKFTREGAVKVTVDLKGSDGKSVSLRFKVPDAGNGWAQGHSADS